MKKFVKFEFSIYGLYSFTDFKDMIGAKIKKKQTDTQTYTHTDVLITILCKVCEQRGCNLFAASSYIVLFEPFYPVDTVLFIAFCCSISCLLYLCLQINIICFAHRLHSAQIQYIGRTYFCNFVCLHGYEFFRRGYEASGVKFCTVVHRHPGQRILSFRGTLLSQKPKIGRIGQPPGNKVYYRKAYRKTSRYRCAVRGIWRGVWT